MASCCEHECETEGLIKKQKGTLMTVLIINAFMFIIIVVGAWYANSTALLSDSLDNLGDALTYGLSFFAVNKSPRIKAKIALFKGLMIYAACCVVVYEIGQKLSQPITPLFEVMTLFSLLGLVANGLCVLLLWRHRNQDINMSSVYECSRNDIAANLSVLLAAGGVWYFESGWPDIAIAGILAGLLLRSSLKVTRQSLRQIRYG